MQKSSVHCLSRPNGYIILSEDIKARRAADQLWGSCYDKIAEVAGRVCYDSFGKGRSSEDWHAHIAKVKHFNVYEHCYFTLQFPLSSQLSRFQISDLATAFANRPGLYWRFSLEHDSIFASMNLRCAIEWDERGTLGIRADSHVRQAVLAYAQELTDFAPIPDHDRGIHTNNVDLVTKPESRFDRYHSFILTGSRPWAMEQIRHRWQCAVSMRSTRYCDESETDWVMHPLIRDYNRKAQSPIEFGVVQDLARAHYDLTHEKLVAFCEQEGMTKSDARKQARGAARWCLGLALKTEMVFTMSEMAMEHIANMRISSAADAEIREIVSMIEGARIS